MVDLEKLSGLTEAKSEKKDNGVDIMQAIGGVTKLIQEAKGLKNALEPQQEPINVTPAKPMIQAVKPKEPATMGLQKAPEPQPEVVKKPVEASDEEVEASFEKILQALHFGQIFYGDIPISQFASEIQKDKEKILLTIKGLL